MSGIVDGTEHIWLLSPAHSGTFHCSVVALMLFIPWLPALCRFDTNLAGSPLIYGDQFLQISTLLSSNQLYGFGEHQAALQKGGGWSRYSFWARDQPPTVI